MKKTLILYYSFTIVILFSSCSKLLDVNPNDQNSIFPNTVQHFEELLNNNSFGKTDYFLADLMSDDVEIDSFFFTKIENLHLGNAYIWSKDLWRLADKDELYIKAYGDIFQFNILLNEIGNASGGSESEKNILSAKAKINRAYVYLQLVNLYGKAYSSTTSTIDLAVPLILDPLNTKDVSRNSVAEVYDQILKDLDDAIKTKDLPDFGKTVLHPGKIAAFALKARAYLLMSDYENARIAADSVLSKKNTVLDYNTFKFINPNVPLQGIVNKPFTLLELQGKQDELIFAKEGGNPYVLQTLNILIGVSNDLLKCYSTDDLRFIFNFVTDLGSYFYTPYNDNGVYTLINDNSINVPEIMLIKAECLARQSQYDEALALVNELRKYRFAPDKYTPLVENSNNILKIVLEERRRELPLRGGLRLFDLKRLNNEEKFKRDIYRYSNNKIIATLPANSPRYLFQFSNNVLLANPKILQNER